MSNYYGTVNGKKVYSRDEFIYTWRGFGELTDDAELVKYAEKVTSNWYDAGWHRTFRTYYLGDYALSEPKASLTDREYERLKALQLVEQKRYDEAEKKRDWKKFSTIYYADNSVEELWRDKNGEEKRVMAVAPHGDVCY